MRTSLFICLLVAGAIHCNQREERVLKVRLSKTTQSNGGDLQQPLTSYYVKTVIGNPGKPFRLLVDLNARENWVPHYHKIGKVFPRLNYLDGYAKKNSVTSEKEEGKEYTINHDSCLLKGKAYKDIFEFRDVVESSHEPKFSQRFLAISSASNSKFSDRGGVDGVMSLNPLKISEDSSYLLINLIKENLMGGSRFGLALNGSQTMSNDPESGGELTFGQPNLGYSTSLLAFHDVWSAHEWSVKIQKVMLGAASVSCSETCSALISTGHNDIYGPSTGVEQILTLLGFEDEIKKNGFQADKLYELDCSKVADSPVLTFNIDESYYRIPASSYIRKKVNRFFKSETCYVAILANADSFNGNDKWILGTNFLANFYSVFDVSNRRIAFAEL